MCEVVATVNICRVACSFSDSVSNFFTNISSRYLFNVFILFFFPLALTVKVHWFHFKTFKSSESWHRFFLQAKGPRPWYVLIHSPNDLKNSFDCVVVYYGRPEGNIDIVSIQASVIRSVKNVHCLFTACLTWKFTECLRLFLFRELWWW
jgi:hypothetical protein